MSEKQIWFDKHGQPIDAATANDLLGDMAYKRVALTEVTSHTDPDIKHRVSTVWLGANHNFSGGPPILFETMVFGPDDADEYMVRYSTEDEARTGHAETVTLVAATVPDEIVTDLEEWPA